MTMTPSSLFRLGLLAVLLAAPLSAQAQSEQKLPSVSVTGEASISKAPDIAILQAGVTSQAKTARDAMIGERQVDDGRAGVAERQRHRRERYPDQSRLSLQPIREPNKNPANIIAVEASSLLTVRVRDINKSADVLDKMITAGANLVTGINFEVSERVQAARSGARSKRSPTPNAKPRFTPRRPASRSAVRSRSRKAISRARSMQDYAMRAAPAAMPIQAGEEKIGINVQVSYELLR